VGGGAQSYLGSALPRQTGPYCRIESPQRTVKSISLSLRHHTFLLSPEPLTQEKKKLKQKHEPLNRIQLHLLYCSTTLRQKSTWGEKKNVKRELGAFLSKATSPQSLARRNGPEPSDSKERREKKRGGDSKETPATILESSTASITLLLTTKQQRKIESASHKDNWGGR